MEITGKLRGGDLRSIGKVNIVIRSVKTQDQFDMLFKNIFSHERIIAMRAADAVEKLTRENPSFLDKHKDLLLELIHTGKNKELKWHWAQLITRVTLSENEFHMVWNKLVYWLLNPNESRIVRVNSLQALYDLSRINPSFFQTLNDLVNSVGHENIPSLNARIKKLNLV